MQQSVTYSSGRGTYELAVGHLALQFCVLNVAKSEPTEKKIEKMLNSKKIVEKKAWAQCKMRPYKITGITPAYHIAQTLELNFHIFLASKILTLFQSFPNFEIFWLCVAVFTRIHQTSFVWLFVSMHFTFPRFIVKVNVREISLDLL